MNVTKQGLFYLKKAPRLRLAHLPLLLGCAGWFLGLLPPISVLAQSEVFAAHAKKVYSETKAKTHQNPDQAQAAHIFARACFAWADFSTSDQQREQLAEEGIAAAKRGIRINAMSADSHYCLALNLGQLARTKTLSALKIVKNMEKEFLKAIAINPKIDFAGPHRALGVLYRDAPGWPVSLGSQQNSRKHLEAAVKLFPNYPGNNLSLLEGYLEWDQHPLISKKIDATNKMLKKARTQLTGKTWASSWAEWDARWKIIRSKLKDKKN